MKKILITLPSNLVQSVTSFAQNGWKLLEEDKKKVWIRHSNTTLSHSGDPESIILIEESLYLAKPTLELI